MGKYADLTPQQKKDTEPWILNEADKRAVEAGMWWDMESAAYTIWWVERFCKLYEGAGYAGKPLYVNGYHDQPEPEFIFDFYEDRDYTLDVFRNRFEEYYAVREERDYVGWQLDFFARCYAFQQYSDRWARRGIPRIRRFQSASIFIPKKSGKASAFTTPVPTPSGWTTIGELKEGDSVFDEDGKSCHVTQLHPILFRPTSYEITFSNGEKTQVNGDHIWPVESLRQKQSHKAQRGVNRKGGEKTVFNKRGSHYKEDWTTQEMYDAGVLYGKARCFRLQMHPGLELPDDKTLPLDPYLLGVWLGDGDSDRFCITSHKDDTPHYVGEFAAAGYGIRYSRSKDNTDRISFDKGEGHGRLSEANSILRCSGIHKNKHIPEQYLRASFEQRVALLQGLLDTDGHITKSGKGISFCNTNERIIRAVEELLASLGIKYSSRKKKTQWEYKGEIKTGHAWELRFHTYREHFEAFRLPRKLARQRSCGDLEMSSGRSRTVHITAIEPCTPVPMRCITVSSDSGTYLFGRTMLATHNSPTLAANVVYLTCGDGEPGNKVFIGAGNMDQAGITWKHAYLMLKQSEELWRDIKPNMSTKRMEYLPDNSTFEPMSSANTRSVDAKEGLNGSCCLDELHILDPEYVSVLQYMGVSRPEPLRLGFSTAGRDPEAYGAVHWAYGERVNEGLEEDLKHLHISYGIPQDLKPEQLAEDPEYYIRLANPALGHTVDMEELLPAYHAVKNDARELRKFMMYRLNQFQNAAAAWLNPGVWAACGSDPFQESYLQAKPCVIGLDLARRYDLASAVVAWLDDEDEDGNRKILLRPYFWCAEDIVRERSSRINGFIDWEAGGHIKATPGNVIDFRTIENDLRQLMTTYNVQGLTYDATYAEDLVQRLTDGVTGPDGNYIYEPLVVGEKAVSQSMMTMTGMTTDFENDAKSGILVHDRNPVLTWQIGNAKIKEDNSGNIKVVKESRESFRTVDGVVAAIMARWGLVDCDDFNIETLDFYLHNDVEFV